MRNHNSPSIDVQGPSTPCLHGEPSKTQWTRLSLWGLILLASSALGQARPWQLQAELGGFLVSGPMPFWLRANQYGLVPLAGSLATLRLGLAADYRSPRPADSLYKARKLDWGYGLELVGNSAQPVQGLLAEAYLKGRWGPLELYAGRRRGIVGLVDTLLTSGSYAWSGNALPLPVVQLGTLGFVDIPFTKGFVALNTRINYGWFENTDKKVLDTRLHQFALYVRLGKATGKLSLYAGINHQVVWGGHSDYLANNVSNGGQLPSSLKAYIYAVTGLPYPSTGVDPNVSSIDEGNRIGNHLGSVDIGAQVRLGWGRVLLYRQNPYDTGALYYLTTIADGLNGVSFRRAQGGRGWLTVTQGVIEWLFTESQGGSFFVLGDPYRQGRVNYFNNSQYIDGWRYFGRTIGTPFLTPQTEVTSTLPVSYPVANTRVSVWHVGLAGQLAGRVDWQTKLSFSQNLGTYDVPYPRNTTQFSALLTAASPLRLPALGAVQIQASLALDSGQLLPAGWGTYLGVRKVLFELPRRGNLSVPH